MLALLPELDGPPPRVAFSVVIGPKVNFSSVPPGIVERIREVELGRAEPPVIPVETTNNRLVLLVKPEEVLGDWLVYKLGSFSTCHVRYVVLSSQERNDNVRAIQRLQLEAATKLTELLGEVEEGDALYPPGVHDEEEEEDPFEDDDARFDREGAEP